jgi:hypothetical protein
MPSPAPCGFDGELFGEIVRIFVDEVGRHHARRARALGLVIEVCSGSIAYPQRFGSTLNLTRTCTSLRSTASTRVPPRAGSVTCSVGD